MSQKEFVDFQVFLLIKTHPGTCERGLLKIAQFEMKCTKWTYNLIHHSVSRWIKKGKVRTRLVLSEGHSCKRLYLK